MQHFFCLLDPKVVMPRKNPMRYLIIQEFEVMQMVIKTLLQSMELKIHSTMMAGQHRILALITASQLIL